MQAHQESNGWKIEDTGLPVKDVREWMENLCRCTRAHVHRLKGGVHVVRCPTGAVNVKWFLPSYIMITDYIHTCMYVLSNTRTVVCHVSSIIIQV